MALYFGTTYIRDIFLHGRLHSPDHEHHHLSLELSERQRNTRTLLISSVLASDEVRIQLPVFVARADAEEPSKPLDDNEAHQESQLHDTASESQKEHGWKKSRSDVVVA